LTSGLPNVNNRGFMAKISDKDEIVDIYLKYQKSLLRLAMTYVDRSYLAEDIVGDTIIAVLERPLEFENEASCACYMRRTVRNKSISLLRRKYQIDLLDDANDIEKRIIELSSSDKSYNDIEVQVLLHEILAEYPKEIREALLRIYLTMKPYPRSRRIMA
jgi:RNA polymerase sigma factor (sigma-70 family)